MKKFDRKFGPQFLESVPSSPGVYRIYDVAGALIYVGKAKNLKRRLGQYRNAKRFRKHHKMRAIVGDASKIEFEVCGSELDALLLELRLIQECRPKWNVAGAFYFFYPLIGILRKDDLCSFCYTTSPELLPDFEFHGAYRSRWIVGEAFFSLMNLLEYVGHRSPGKARVPGSYSYVFSYRRLPVEWDLLWSALFKGESKAAFETLILALVENAAARRAGADVQVQLNDLARFWRHEALPLNKARRALNYEAYPVAQRERDLIFVKNSCRLKVSRIGQGVLTLLGVEKGDDEES